MRFCPLGVGDAFTALHYTTCLAVEHEGVWLLVDCPHPIRKMMREADAELDVADVAAVLLTHLHADHASGLEGFGYFSHFALGRRARIVASEAVSARLWDGHLAAGMERMLRPAPERFTLGDWFEVQPPPTTIGPFAIEARPTTHHIPTTAFRITAGGRSLAVSGDTAFDPALIEWLCASDVVIHEANHGPAHTPYAALAALAPSTRGKMRLWHLPDDHEGDAIERLVQGRVYAV